MSEPSPSSGPARTVLLPDFAIGDVLTSFPALYQLASERPLRIWFENPQIRSLWAGPRVDLLSDAQNGSVFDIRDPAHFFKTSGLHMIQSWFWNFGLAIPETIPRIRLAGGIGEPIDVIVSPYSASGAALAPWKVWPYENWNRVIDGLLAAGLSVAVCGVFKQGVNPRSLDQPFWGNRAVRVLDSLPLLELASLLRAARCVVTVDNGIAHLAHLLGAQHAQIIPAHPDLFAAGWVVNRNANAAWIHAPFTAQREYPAALAPERVLELIFGVLAAFNKAAYLQSNPDVAAGGMDAWHHWVLYGRDEGRTLGFTPTPINFGARWA